MSSNQYKSGIFSERLPAGEYDGNFSDMHPPLDAHEALVASDRCYFCYDAPCISACPTEIDIPMFIRQIAVGDVVGSAKTIFDQNIMGGMCARVCPTETLCESACVREAAEGKPVQIGLLQRYATDRVIDAGKQLYQRAAATGKTIAIVGAGPAGLACAHGLAQRGHNVVIYEAQEKAGGLNEYGIAAYKTTDHFAQKEIDYISAIGGIKIEYNTRLGRDITPDELRQKYDGVFLAMGLGGVNALAIPGSDAEGVDDAVSFIAQLRQSKQLSALPIGRRVVVIGGGMTAIDAAVQSKLLGAEEVTLCYRNTRQHMKASVYEQEFAAAKGVLVRCQLQPQEILTDDHGKVRGMVLEYTEDKNGKLVGNGNSTTIVADQIFKAIGQTLITAGVDGVKTKNGKIIIDGSGRTSLPNVWAGGDCAVGGDDLTVSAVAMGRDAAVAIHQTLTTA